MNSAPTAGVPEKDRPVCDPDTSCRTARANPVAMSPAAPAAGVTVTSTPTLSAVMSAAAAVGPENQRLRLRGPLISSSRGFSRSDRRVWSGTPPCSPLHLL